MAYGSMAHGVHQAVSGDKHAEREREKEERSLENRSQVSARLPFFSTTDRIASLILTVPLCLRCSCLCQCLKMVTQLTLSPLVLLSIFAMTSVTGPYVGTCGNSASLEYGKQIARPMVVTKGKVFFPHDLKTANEYCE